jgi:hypothetical protein
LLAWRSLRQFINVIIFVVAALCFLTHSVLVAPMSLPLSSKRQYGRLLPRRLSSEHLAAHAACSQAAYYRPRDRRDRACCDQRDRRLQSLLVALTIVASPASKN